MAPRDSNEPKKDPIFDPDRNPIVRSDWRRLDYKSNKVHLDINLDADETTVLSRFSVKRSRKIPAGTALELKGRAQRLISARIKEEGAEDFRDLDRSEFIVDGEMFVLKHPPAKPFEMEFESQISPKANTQLEGLYSSGDIILSQCESEGFSNITYFLDRPDNAAQYTVTIRGDKIKYPVLLSNGNTYFRNTKDIPGTNLHQITWVDPTYKPSYIFAAVGGKLIPLEDSFTTMSGKEVKLAIFVEPLYAGQVQWAMDSIKRAMKWDEEKYGREYDLDYFNIVAVDKFNAGAMENKGLNIFNISRLVGSPETSTDDELIDIENVEVHEYCHNWTGDLVTVLTWLNIAAKEAFTDFRCNQFTKEHHSAGIVTINNANNLRATQFPEDSGPSAHWVRPDRVESINNLYSRTVYGKGSHIFGMINTILGDKEWRKVTDAYFKKYKNKAVTIENLLDTVEKVSGVSMEQFSIWFRQTGTPEISYEGKYDPATRTYALTLKQHVPATWDQTAAEKQNLHIPVAMGLIDKKSGKDISLVLDGDKNGAAVETTRVLNLKDGEQTFVFKDVDGPVVPSVLRGFSAPVKVVTKPSHEELVFRMQHDSDPFNRYEASSALMLKALGGLIEDLQKGKQPAVSQDFLDAYAANLASATKGDQALSALMLSLPPLEIINQTQKTVNPDATWQAVSFMKKALAEKFKPEFEQLYAQTKPPAGQTYEVSPEQVGARSLHNLSLGMLKELATPEIIAAAREQYKATNMTEKLAALTALVKTPGADGDKALADFYETYKDNTNVVDKWLRLEGSTQAADAAEHIREVMDHKGFDITNPNRVRALMGSFTAGDSPVFHKADGSGYKLLADVVIKLNSINPRVGAQIVKPLTRFSRFDGAHQTLMIEQLKRIMATPDLAVDTKAFVGEALATIASQQKAKPATPKGL